MNGIFEALKPTIKFLIPIHYRNEKCDFRFITVAEFCRGKQNVKSMKESKVECTRLSLPTTVQIVILEPAL
jgi:hypothetical protein